LRRDGCTRTASAASKAAALRDDVMTTMAIWQRAGVTPQEAWFAMTGEFRHDATAGKVCGFMIGWLAQSIKSAQLSLEFAGNEGEDMDWFRSHHGAPTDPKWLIVARRAGVPAVSVAAVFWALLDYASQHEDRGSVAGFDVETVAAFYGIGEAEVGAILGALAEKGLIRDGRIASWSKRQPKREDPGAAERKRRQRAAAETKKAASRDVTHGHDRERERENLSPPTPPSEGGGVRRRRIRGGAPSSLPPDPTPEAAERDRRRWWGETPDWWRRFDPSQQLRVRRWVEKGIWHSAGPPPDEPGCVLDPDLAAVAVAERRRRRAQEPELLLPIEGGGPPQSAPDAAAAAGEKAA
jgi:hypothetical protein